MQLEPATNDDIPELCQLLGRLLPHETEFLSTPAERTQGLKSLIDGIGRSCVLVARDNNQILAMVSLSYTDSAGAKVALLEDMIVTPHARGQGIGSQLLEYTLRFAKARRIARISVLAHHENVTAQRFYKRHGFVSPPGHRRVISFSKSLS
jgi:GNAT superfamily N-acetyltransferase